MERRSFVYIMASERNGTLYIGVTSDLVKRVWEHKNKSFKGFTSRYDVKDLVYYEAFDDITEAIKREKAMKKWRRAWKTEVIDRTNPDWDDLWNQITQ